MSNMYEDDEVFERDLSRALEDVKTTLMKKRKLYGSGNMKKFGEYGTIVRLSDKVERLINLTDVEGLVDTEDTWLDAAGYCILGMMQRRV